MTSMKPVGGATVLVVDDDPAVRNGVSRLVRAAGFTVETFAEPEAFLRRGPPAGPACVLLDLCMEGMTGLQVQEALREGDRQVPVVFLSGHATIPEAVTGLKQGAFHFLEKPFRPDELLDAVGRAIEQDRARAAEREKLGELTARFDLLTPREKEVMSLVVSGLLNKQAAAELGIAEKTIKVHRARVMEKMNVESLPELIFLSQRLGLPSRPADQWAEAGAEARTYPPPRC